MAADRGTPVYLRAPAAHTRFGTTGAELGRTLGPAFCFGSVLLAAFIALILFGILTNTID
ncbi:hypothetical protein OG874_01645 [Nocardia sp. NBC_00565]|uniref:hypothetical protein n=1 Tax=Nocardia sp. NBC_00565 TaxID=2975993 RepID=UPI002E7FF348|nr:hypothetical protein [Nocardia sp. NBC_00565]WUC03945.1 hypothetical protein OG874_01645 [Nocardia sp. NBC_00565]